VRETLECSLCRIFANPILRPQAVPMSATRSRLAVAAALAATGCAPPADPDGASTETAEGQALARSDDASASTAPLRDDGVIVAIPLVAAAQMRPVGEGSARGTIEFRGTEGGPLVVNVMMLGLVAGEHAVHVHASGDCAAHGATPRAYAPLPDGEERDLGEIGNVTAEASGLAHVSLQATSGFDRSLVGQVVVVHAGAADLVARPGGGAVVACGVIETASRRNLDRSRQPRRLNA
jgi:Cu-Zn family superoxide dismutase